MFVKQGKKHYLEPPFVLTRSIRHFIPASAIILLLLGFISYKAISLLAQANNDSLDLQAESVIEIVTNMIQHDFDMIQEDINFLTNSVEGSGYLNGYHSDAHDTLEQLFISGLLTHNFYDHIRLLDRHGKELIRVNNNNNRPQPVSKNKLQNKSKRYYYQEAMKLMPGQIYTSRLDLNYEEGKLEYPLKPVLRLVSPIRDHNNKILALMVLNYDAHRILERIQFHLNKLKDDAMMLDESGFWLLRDGEALEWGFLLDHSHSLAINSPEIWQKINTDSSQSFIYKNKRYISNSILLKPKMTAQEGPSRPQITKEWKIVIAHKISGVTWSFLLSHHAFSLIIFTTFPLSILLVWVLCVQEAKRKKAEIALQTLNISLESKIKSRTEEIQMTKYVTIDCLVNLAATRDNETGAHIRRSQAYIQLLLDNLLKLSPYKEQLLPHSIELIIKSAALHDIGKIGIPDYILLKEGKLTEEEFSIMKRHTILGFNALQMAIDSLPKNESPSFLSYARDIAYCHHEKWDGSGYPNGLSGDAIPLVARLMSLADVYDALVSKRVYKEAFSQEQTEDIILNQSEGHFDPELLKIFYKNKEKFWEIAQCIRD